MKKLLPLLLLSLLLGSNACSKKDDPTSPVSPTAGTASYKLNGGLISCQPTVYLRALTGEDQLIIRLTTTPQPASGAEYLDLYFSKPTGQPNAAYKPSEQRFYNASTSALGGLFTSPSITFAETSTRGFSGTFAGTAISATSSHSITEGIFTDLHP